MNILHDIPTSGHDQTLRTKEDKKRVALHYLKKKKTLLFPRQIKAYISPSLTSLLLPLALLFKSKSLTSRARS